MKNLHLLFIFIFLTNCSNITEDKCFSAFDAKYTNNMSSQYSHFRWNKSPIMFVDLGIIGNIKNNTSHIYIKIDEFGFHALGAFSIPKNIKLKSWFYESTTCNSEELANKEYKIGCRSLSGTDATYFIYNQNKGITSWVSKNENFNSTEKLISKIGVAAYRKC